MNAISNDAKGFVEGVVRYIRTGGQSQSVLPKVQSLLHKVTSATRKEKIAMVQSSVALTVNERQKLQKILNRILGHEVILECTVQPTLIGGLRIQIGDWVVDTSMKEQLEAMGRSLVA